MTRIPTHLMLSGVLMSLAACGGGGGNDDPAGQQSPLFFGSTDPIASRSGLDYANGTQSTDDLQGQTQRVRVLRVVKNNQTGESTQVISDEELTISTDGLPGSLRITLDGETLEFVDGVAKRDDETQVIVSEASLTRQFHRTLEIIEAAAFGGRPDETTVALLVTGFETNPDTVETLTGSASYFGAVNGRNDFGPIGNAVSGTIFLNSDFATGKVDGNVSISEFDSQFGFGTLAFDVEAAGITGNGFESNLTLTDCSYDNCTAGGEIAGVFFGPVADEVAGLLTFDVTATDSAGDSSQVDSIASFSAPPVSPCASVAGPEDGGAGC